MLCAQSDQILTEIKKGKLTTSHRYDPIPLLRSRPGGFSGSWSCRTYPTTKVQLFFIPRKSVGLLMIFFVTSRLIFINGYGNRF